MIEKTLRYPGTIEYLKVLRESGFFSHQEIEVKGMKVKPIDVTTQLLLPLWELKHGEEDFTIMKASVYGSLNHVPVGYEYLIYDQFDAKSGIHSMARTTGYTCTAVCDLFLNTPIEKKGLLPPEEIAAHKESFVKIMNHLESHGIEVTVTRLY